MTGDRIERDGSGPAQALVAGTGEADMSGVPESWLRAKSTLRFVSAIVQCGSGDPSWCSAHGRCRRGGACFDPDVQSVRAMTREELRAEVARLRGEVTRLERLVYGGGA